MSLIIPISDLADPRLADYTAVKERQLAAEFVERTPHAGATPTGAGDPATPWGKFIAEGELVFRKLCQSPFPVVSVLTTPTRLASIQADLAQLPLQTPVYVLDQAAMDQVAGFPIHRGLLAIGARRPPGDVEVVLAAITPERPLVVLEDVVNNDNTGAIFRNAAALGAGGVLLSRGSADPLYRKALRVSVGHALHVPWARFSDVRLLMARLEALGIQTLALTPRGPGVVSLRELSRERNAATTAARPRVALLVGAEGPGLGADVLGLADVRVSIPMADGVDSLNVATAAAVALYELGGGAGRELRPIGEGGRNLGKSGA